MLPSKGFQRGASQNLLPIFVPCCPCYCLFRQVDPRQSLGDTSRSQPCELLPPSMLTKNMWAAVCRAAVGAALSLCLRLRCPTPGHDRMHTEISSSCEFAQPRSHGIAFMMRWLSALATNQGPVCQFAGSNRPLPTFHPPNLGMPRNHPMAIRPSPITSSPGTHDSLDTSGMRCPSVGSTSALAQVQLLLRFKLCTDQTPPGFGVCPSLSSAAVSAVYSSARGRLAHV